MLIYALTAAAIGALAGWIARSLAGSREVANARSASWKDCCRHYHIETESPFDPGNAAQRQHNTAALKRIVITRASR